MYAQQLLFPHVQHYNMGILCVQLVDPKSGKEAKMKVLDKLGYDPTQGFLFSSIDNPQADSLQISAILADPDSTLRPLALRAAAELKSKAGRSLQDSKVV